jgi:F-type H+-transporting ATPase subunit epsilon
VTPSGQIFDANIKSVTLPGKDGEFGVLPGHSALVTPLSVGVIVIENEDGSEDAIAIDWGYVTVGEEKIDALVNGAVSLTGNSDSEISKNIAAAKELVSSVQDSNTTAAFVESKINSFA